MKRTFPDVKQHIAVSTARQARSHRLFSNFREVNLSTALRIRPSFRCSLPSRNCGRKTRQKNIVPTRVKAA